MSSDPQEIKAFWESRASSVDLTDETVTLPDFNQRLLEIDAVLQYLPDGRRVLDVGCGNGYSTAIYSAHAEQVVGIDYADSMVERARRNYSHLQNVRFEVMDVLTLDLPPASFDVAISQRCLINLSTWEDQQKAIANIAHVLKPGGCFMLQEGTRQGREKLNQAREMLGLSRMPKVAYNLDFDEEALWPFIRQYFRVVEIKRFALYDLIARVVHPLLVSPEEPKYDAKINQVACQVASRLEVTGDIGREFSAFLRRLDDVG